MDLNKVITDLKVTGNYEFAIFFVNERKALLCKQR